MGILITGIAGQDGLILGAALQAREIPFFGVCRTSQAEYVENALPGFSPICSDLSVPGNMTKILKRVKPTKVFNFAGFSSVKRSWREQELTFQLNYSLPREIIEWIELENPETYLLQATSSEIFAGSNQIPQNELTPIAPLSPYGRSKAKAHNYLGEVRDRSGLKLSSAIMYNHESPIRSTEFVTRHISMSIARICANKSTTLTIGNTLASRDWGWAPDYVDALFKVMQLDYVGDFVLSTGIVSTVGDLIRYGFESVGINDFDKYVAIEPGRIRAVDSQTLVGNSTFINNFCGWAPTVSIKEGIAKMVKNDIKILKSKKNLNSLEWY